MKWLALITLGCFFTLAAFSTGKYHPDAKPERGSLSAFMAEKIDAHVPRAAEVKLWKAPQTRLERIVAHANGHRVTDRVAAAGLSKRAECGDDFVCLLAWAGR